MHIAEEEEGRKRREGKVVEGRVSGGSIEHCCPWINERGA